MKRRVVVTGIGLVTPLGNDVRSTWDSLVNGRTGIGRITRFDASTFASQIAAEVRGFEPEKYFEAKQAKNLDHFVQYAIAAAEEAFTGSGLVIAEADQDRLGSITGCGMGGLPPIEQT